MAIYSASYFEPQNHHGSLVSISRSHPRSFQIDTKLTFLSPSQALLDDWKHHQLTEEAYADRYRQELQQSWPQLNSWLTSLTSERDCILLCWEKAGEFCHRNLAMKVIRKHRPDCYGGRDISADPRLRCPNCQTAIIPGIDQSYCPSCCEWLTSSSNQPNGMAGDSPDRSEDFLLQCQLTRIHD